MTTATGTRSAEEIQGDVLEELSWDALVQPNEIGVTVRGAVVTLTGWVDSYAKKWAAEQAAHRVRGVRTVANDIEVRLPATAERTDGDLAAAVTNSLVWDTFVPEENLDVTVANGWVTLRGAVEWGYQKRTAERAVRGLAGIRGVTNLISVMPVSTVLAEGMEQDIRDGLVRTLGVDADRIKVEIDGGTVVLSGAVGSWMEREQAQRVAWSAPGIRAVEDRLTVAT